MAERCTWFMSVIAIISQVYLSSNGARITRDINEFTQTINDFSRNILGADKFQDYLDTSQDVSYQESPFDGPAIASEIRNSLSVKFRERSDAVRELRDAVRDNWNSYGTQRVFDECCNVQPAETDPGFKTEVDFQNLCVFGLGYNQDPQKLATTSLLDAMKRNVQQNPLIKYQYLGTEEGVIFRYPSAKFCSQTYDPRFRPWYVQTTTPAPKDVVIVIDHSGSMGVQSHGRSLMDIAIEAGTTVIDTLNPNDRVGVVAFSSSARTPSGTSELGNCFSSELAMATPRNTAYLREFVESLSSGGGTQYILALNSAFRLFDGTPQMALADERTRDRVILFLTDGEPSEDGPAILARLRDLNAEVNNTVAVITFGLGSGLSDAAKNILEKIAQQEDTVGEVPRKNLIEVSNPTNLRFRMASYYKEFVRAGTGTDVTITVPYFDAFGLGLITSICLPVLLSTDNKGVVCVDISMADLLSDVTTFFTPGLQSYAFIMDQQSRLLLHPYLPTPLNVDTDPIFVTMGVLETGEDAKAVMQSMLSGGSGNRTFGSRRIISRGNTEQEGIDESEIKSEYIWNQITGTSLSLCLVIGEGDEQATISWLAGSYPSSPVYHRFDLQDDISTCNYFCQASLKDRSSIKFSPDSFEEPYTYIEEEEKDATVDRYLGYVSGRISNNPGFKGGIRETVAATNQFDILSSARDDTAEDVAVWTYVGMNNGVFRITPGITLHKLYDHTRRAWYQRALANKKSNAFSTPYEDAFGSGKVITMSKAIFEGRRTGDHAFDDVVVGVMGLDFTVDYFYVLLVTHFPECDQASPGCLVVDSAGLVVMHTDWYNGADVTENTHIISKEPSIALNLINSQTMTQESCVNYESSRTQYFWRLSTSRTISNTLFDLYPVMNTNIIVIVKKTVGSSSAPQCSCGSTGSSLPRCRSSPPGCECPCHSATQFYMHCRNVYEVTEDTPPPCAPRESPYVVPVVTSDATQLDRCFLEVDCSSLDKLSCYSSKQCIYTGSSCEKREPCSGSEEGGTNVVAIVVPIVVVLVLVIAAVVVFVIYKRTHSPRPSSSSTSTEVHHNPAMSHVQPSAPTHDHSPPFNPHYNSGMEPPPPYSAK